MTLLEVLQQPVWQQFTLTLLHFLWQGVMVAAILVVVLGWCDARRTRARYGLCLVAMLVMAACPVLTFAVLRLSSAESEAGVQFSDAALAASPVAGEIPLTESPAGWALQAPIRQGSRGSCWHGSPAWECWAAVCCWGSSVSRGSNGVDNRFGANWRKPSPGSAGAWASPRRQPFSRPNGFARHWWSVFGGR